MMKGQNKFCNQQRTQSTKPINTIIEVKGTLLLPFIAAVIVGVFQVFLPSPMPSTQWGLFLATMAAFSLIAFAVSFSTLPYGRFKGFIVPAFVLAGTILFWILHSASYGNELVFYVVVSQLILWGYTLARTNFRAALTACWILSSIALTIIQVAPHFSQESDIFGVILLIATNLLGFHIIHSTRKLTAHIRTLSKKANTDNVTGAANRHHFTELMEHECARAERSGKPLSLLLIDIDHFKGINDHYGHLAGDAVLRTLTNCIRLTIRASDICGRYGGDEFAILLTDATPAGARLTAQRIFAAIDDTTVIDHGRQINFSISVGIANYHLTVNRSLDGLIRAADEALYQAKQDGRNRIHCAHDEEWGRLEQQSISQAREQLETKILELRTLIASHKHQDDFETQWVISLLDWRIGELEQEKKQLP